MESNDANFNCGNAKMNRACLVLIGLVPVESLQVVVASGLQGCLDNGILASVEPDDSNMEGGVLVHEAERLEDVLKLSLRMCFRIPLSVATAKLHVPVEQA